MKPIILILTLFSLLPSYAGITILNGLTHIHNSSKGSSISGEIIIQNMNKENQERVTIYMEDVNHECNAENPVLGEDELQRSLAKWISFNTTERVLEPNEKFILKYNLTVPETFNSDIDEFGSFWSTVMVEGDTPIKENYQDGLQISSKIRYGIQMVVNIGNMVDPEIDFVNIDLNKKNNTIHNLDISLENQGVFLVKPTLILELFNDMGDKVYKTKAEFKKVYPKGCKDFLMQIKDVPKGSYEGVLVADYGGDMFGINLTLDIEE